MLTTVEAIVERLVTGYAPDRIILFGSRAAGGTRPDSDVDLSVVKETDSVYRGRYPTEAELLPHGEPSEEDASRAVAVADAVMRQARATLEARPT